MRFMATYDMMETMRNTNQWLGASAQAMASYPATSMFPNPMAEWMAAWGQVTERTFARMVTKPDWNIPNVTGEDVRDHIVEVETCLERPFGDLIHFQVTDRPQKKTSCTFGGADVWPLCDTAALHRHQLAA